MKSNYSEAGGKFDIEWRDGVFVPVNRAGGFDKMAAEQKADDIFLKLVGKFECEGRDVSPNPGTTFAPAVFSKHPDAGGTTKEALRAAMNRLLNAGKIKIKTFGPPSRQRKRLIIPSVDGDT
jgi:hypothetical protein